MKEINVLRRWQIWYIGEGDTATFSCANRTGRDETGYDYGFKTQKEAIDAFPNKDDYIAVDVRDLVCGVHDWHTSYF